MLAFVEELSAFASEPDAQERLDVLVAKKAEAVQLAQSDVFEYGGAAISGDPSARDPPRHWTPRHVGAAMVFPRCGRLRDP